MVTKKKGIKIVPLYWGIGKKVLRKGSTYTDYLLIWSEK